jgi:hypothetical protein
LKPVLREHADDCSQPCRVFECPFDSSWSP